MITPFTVFLSEHVSMTFLYSMIALAAYLALVWFVCRFVGFNNYEDD